LPLDETQVRDGKLAKRDIFQHRVKYRGDIRAEIERKMAVDWVRFRASVEKINHGPWSMARER
jgi:hypothetical protein